MPSHTSTLIIRGPWSLATSRRFWEGFTPSALAATRDSGDGTLRTVFRVDADWSVAAVEVTQDEASATLTVEGDGNLDEASAQVARAHRSGAGDP